MHSLSIRSAKNFMSSGRSFSTASKDVLQERLGQVRVGREVGERDLRLDHPELGQVPRRVGFLGAERRAERVHLAHRQAIRLDVELARDGQERRPAEEVLREIDLPSRRRGRFARSSVRDPEHRAGALGVVGGDDRRVDPEEAVLVEEPVDRHASVCRTRVTAPNVFVRGRRCATSRRYSNVCCFGETG